MTICNTAVGSGVGDVRRLQAARSKVVSARAMRRRVTGGSLGCGQR